MMAKDWSFFLDCNVSFKNIHCGSCSPAIICAWLWLPAITIPNIELLSILAWEGMKMSLSGFKFSFNDPWINESKKVLCYSLKISSSGHSEGLHACISIQFYQFNYQNIWQPNNIIHKTSSIWQHCAGHVYASYTRVKSYTRTYSY